MTDASKWIWLNTRGRSSVLDLGAGLLYSSLNIHQSVPWVGGIEVYAPYLEKARHPTIDYHAICGDMTEWRRLVPADFVPDCSMMIDTLEHIERRAALDFVSDLQTSFNLILLFVPIGEHPQNSDAWEMGNDFHQTHKSTWYETDIREMGFDGYIERGFHGEKGDAMFATWERE